MKQVDAPTTRSIARRGIVTLVGTVAGAAIMFGTEIVAANYLGLRLFGCYALAMIFARIGELLSTLGVGIAVWHFIPLYRSRDDHQRLLGVILLALALPVTFGAFLSGLMWLAAPLLATHVLRDPLALPYFHWFAFSIPLLGLSEVCGRITRGYGRIVYDVLVRDLTPRIVYLLLILLLVQWDLPRHWIAGAFAIAYLVASVAGIASVVRASGRALWKVVPEVPYRTLTQYSFLSFVTLILALILGATEFVMIGLLRPSEDAGLFRGAFQFAGVLQFTIHAFAATTAHLYPVLAEPSRRKELHRVYGMATRSVNTLAAPLFALIALNRTDLLALMGQGFPAAADTLLVLLLAQLIRSSTGISTYILMVTGHQKAEIFNSIIGIAVSVTLNFWLVSSYGPLGAAIALCLTMLLLAVVRTAQLRRYFGVTTISVETMTPLVICGLCGLIIEGVVRYLHVGNGSGITALTLRLLGSAVFLTVSLAGYYYGCHFREGRIEKK